jgi:hypothetical protein
MSSALRLLCGAVLMLAVAGCANAGADSTEPTRTADKPPGSATFYIHGSTGMTVNSGSW